jgi:hypothetical protein
VFCLFSYYLKDYEQAAVTLLASPLVLISAFLFKKGFVTTSKLLNILQIVMVITMLCLLTGNYSFAFMYYFPVIISCLIIFKGQHKKLGYLILLLIVVLLIIVTYLDIRIGINSYDSEHQKADQISNIVGVCTACILLFAFSIKSTEIIQRRLIEKTKEVQSKNEQLAATIYTRDKMMSVISHDLRSPIIALNSAMNIFSNQEIDPIIQKDIIGQIENKSNNLLSMIDELLSWTKSQSISINVNLEKIEISYLLNYALEQIQIIGESKNINLEVINNSKAKHILGDKNMLDAVLRNLISNAVKFSSSGNKIQFTITDNNNSCEVSIRDFGKGMSEKELKDFKKGIAFTTIGTANEKGHGLGLQLVKEFLHKQNAELNVESHEGFGSRFYFSLPIEN